MLTRGYGDGVERSLIPLLLASASAVTDRETEPLDRLRMQKAAFLIDMRGPESWRHLYDFRPYNWGPYSGVLTADLDSLIKRNLMATVNTGRRHDGYVTTLAGESEVDNGTASGAIAASDLKFVQSVRRYVTTRSFSQLLRDVYDAYPDYAVRSRFSG